MWDKSFHRLCGFQGFGTNVTWDGVRREGDTMGVKAVRRRRRTRRLVECPRKQETTTPHQWPQLFGIIILSGPQEFLRGAQAFTVNLHAHTRITQGMLTTTAPTVLRESEEWYREEFQISEAILYFPPGREDLGASRPALWTSEPHLSPEKWLLFFFLWGQIKYELFNTGILDVGYQKNCVFSFFCSTRPLKSPLSVSPSLPLISARLNVSSGTRIPCLCASTNTRGGTSNCINRWPESIKHTQIKCWTHLLYAEAH